MCRVPTPRRATGRGPPTHDLSERRQWRRRVSDGLWSLTEGAHETSTHPLPIAEPCLIGDRFDRKSSLLEHEPRRFQPEIFDRFGRRQARFGAEYPAELPRAQARGIREVFDRERRAEVAPGIQKRFLHTIRFRIEIQQRRVL